MVSALKRNLGNTVEIQATLSWLEVSQTYNEIFQHLLEHIEVDGFRKGKVPKDVAEKHINKTTVYEEVLKKMVPQIYAEIVKENRLSPIISPKVEVLAADEGKDWKLKITTAEKPEIKLGNYRQAVQALIESKKNKIWTPQDGKDQKKSSEPTVTEILEALDKEIHVDLAPMIVEYEVNRMLSDLVDQTQKLGMTVEQYLQAKSTTSKSIREEYEKQAKKTLSMEFALEEIANEENIIVEAAEVDKIISEAKTPEEKQTLEKQKYYLSSILRRQKTIQMLTKPSIIKP